MSFAWGVGMQPSGVDDTGTTHQLFLRMEDEVVVDREEVLCPFLGPMEPCRSGCPSMQERACINGEVDDRTADDPIDYNDHSPEI